MCICVTPCMRSVFTSWLAVDGWIHCIETNTESPTEYGVQGGSMIDALAHLLKDTVRPCRFVFFFCFEIPQRGWRIKRQQIYRTKYEVRILRVTWLAISRPTGWVGGLTSQLRLHQQDEAIQSPALRVSPSLGSAGGLGSAVPLACRFLRTVDLLLPNAVSVHLEPTRRR